MSSPGVVLNKKTNARTAEQVSEIMRRVHSRDTQPEMALIRALRKAGFRFKTHASHLRGKPDLVFPLKKLAIFIDGDFWHGIQWRRRGFRSLTAQFIEANHKKYWISKILRNVRRDFRNTTQLIDSGWWVLRFWETDVVRNLERCIEMLARAMRRECNDS